MRLYIILVSVLVNHIAIASFPKTLSPKTLSFLLCGKEGRLWKRRYRLVNVLVNHRKLGLYGGKPSGSFDSCEF